MDEAVCKCSSRKGFCQDPEMLPMEWFVCAQCMKPTRMYLENAFTRATTVGVDDGEVVDDL